MRRNRRKQQADHVNLFAFQDVMASVIGILFFVVLLMALDIVHASPADKMSEEREKLLALNKEKEDLSAELRLLRERIGEISEKAVAASSPESFADDVREKHARLRAIHARIISENEDLLLAVRKMEETRENTEAVLNEIAHLKARRESIRERLEEERLRPRIAFIRDQATPQEPWLVEVSGENIRIAFYNDVNSVMEISARSTAERRQRFLEFAKAVDRNRFYFCFLAKPSGITQAEQLMEEVRKIRFAVGLDLLPENWNPF